MIAIIIVNWNGSNDTIECLESILRLRDVEFYVLVIDNASSDGSLEKFQRWAISPSPLPTNEVWARLESERTTTPNLQIVKDTDLDTLHPTHGDIVVIKSRENLGFAAANNLGMRVASETSDADYFWILNNDTVVEYASARILQDTCESRAEAGFVGSRLMYYDDPDTIQGLAGEFSVSHIRGRHIGSGCSLEEIPTNDYIERNTSYIMGASIFLPSAVYSEIGGMSERYFLYFEELDWAERLGKRYSQIVCSEAVIYHKEGGSIGTSSRTRPSDTSLYYMNSSLIKYYRAWHPTLLPKALLKVTCRSFKFAFSGDFAAAKYILLAAYEGMFNRRRRGPVSSWAKSARSDS